MKIQTTFSLAIGALMRAKMRSLLTTLGVVIGVAAVIIMQAMGAGATTLVTDELSGLGSNMLIVVPGASQGNMGPPGPGAQLFELSDVEAIRRECPSVRYASPANARSVRVVVGEHNRSTNLMGVGPEYLAIRQWYPVMGRGIELDDVRQGAKVCVLGETVRLDMFGAVDPVGAEIRVHDTTCRVVGVLDPKGASTFGQDQDDLVLIPSTTFARRISGDTGIGLVMLSAVSEERIDEAKAQVESLLRQRRRILQGEDDDFTVRDLREVIALMSTVTGVLTSLLAGVAGVSLVVGGIGIMNIMLVSVTERTREIGIRLAVGARARDILAQFLVEAIVLSLIGGVIGFLLGTAGAWGASHALDIPFTLPPEAALLAISVSVFVGVVFGVFPARKAAHLRPIEALRFE